MARRRDKLADPPIFPNFHWRSKGAPYAGREGKGYPDQCSTGGGIIEEGLSAEIAAKQGSKIIMLPDHRTRHQYAETFLDIAGARAPKQITLESRTYEQKVAIIAEIKTNPEKGVAMILALLEEKRGKSSMN